MDYGEPLVTCDLILDFLQTHRDSSVEQHEIYKHMREKVVEERFITNAMEKLQSDRHLIKQPSNRYTIGPDTLQFIADGKYKGLVKSLLATKDKEEKISDLTEKKLSLDVKNAQRVYNTYWYTFFMALFGLMISITLLILKFIESTKQVY